MKQTYDSMHMDLNKRYFFLVTSQKFIYRQPRQITTHQYLLIWRLKLEHDKSLNAEESAIMSILTGDLMMEIDNDMARITNITTDLMMDENRNLKKSNFIVLYARKILNWFK